VQLAALTTAQISQGLTTAQIAALPTAELQGLGTAQIDAFTTAQIALGLSTQMIAALSTAEIAALHPQQIAALNTAQVSLGLSTAQIRALTPAEIAAIGTAEIGALTTAQLAVLTTRQLAAMTTLQTLQGLTSTQINSLTTAQFVHLTFEQSRPLVALSVTGKPTLERKVSSLVQAMATFEFQGSGSAPAGSSTLPRQSDGGLSILAIAGRVNAISDVLREFDSFGNPISRPSGWASSDAQIGFDSLQSKTEGGYLAKP